MPRFKSLEEENILMITQQFKLDLSCEASEVCIFAKQGDRNSRILHIQLTADGQPFSIPKNATVLFRAVKPDGNMVCYPALLLSEGTVEVPLSDQTLATPGDVVADLQLRDTENRLLACASFFIRVEESPSGYPNASTNEILVFNHLVDQAEQAAASAAASVSELRQNIQNELELAKNSGVFNGPPGPQPPLDATLSLEGYAADARSVGDLLRSIAADGAGAHNSIYRGKNLGQAVSQTQSAAIQDGSFRDLFIGDYWEIAGVVYRIAACDYFLNTGDQYLKQHHLVIVPDTTLGEGKMNDTDTTNGGYIHSQMFLQTLEPIRSIIRKAFPTHHLLSHRMSFVNAVVNGKPTSRVWTTSCIDLMSESMVYGHLMNAPGSDGATIPLNNRVDSSQLPLFRYRPDLITPDLSGPYLGWYWLRDVLSQTNFSSIPYGGYSGRGSSATYNLGIRPFFCIH